MSETTVIVIPARMTSTRFPNKPLVMVKGKAMIERVWRIAMATKGASEVVIATDDQDLKVFAERFGARVQMTSSNCLTGTDRIGEFSRLWDRKHSIFFNLQGDALLTPPWVIEKVLRAMVEDPTIEIATPAVHLKGKSLIDFIVRKKEGSSSGTTVTFNRKGEALYFSKALIPYDRDDLHQKVYLHIGLYGYRINALQQLVNLPEGYFEKAEKLEQLRALENGIPIRVILVDYQGRTHGSIDQPEDLAIIEEIIEKEGELIYTEES